MTESATPSQQSEILADVDEGMKQGALGIGMGLAYTPKVTPEEALNLFYLAAKWKRPVFVHMRYPGGLTPGVVDSIQEMIADAAITGASVHIVHINSMANAKTPEALQDDRGSARSRPGHHHGSLSLYRRSHPAGVQRLQPRLAEAIGNYATPT